MDRPISSDEIEAELWRICQRLDFQVRSHAHTFDYDGGQIEEAGRSANCPGRGQPLARGVVVADHTCSVAECASRSHARGWCNKHYLRWWNHGDPEFQRSLADRFWSKVAKSDGCWEWTGSVNEHGYGQLMDEGADHRLVKAHRLSLRLHGVDLPDDVMVLHRCDNPPCVNPDHLFTGSQQENVADMVAKGRGWWQ